MTAFQLRKSDSLAGKAEKSGWERSFLEDGGGFSTKSVNSFCSRDRVAPEGAWVEGLLVEVNDIV